MKPATTFSLAGATALLAIAVAASAFRAPDPVPPALVYRSPLSPYNPYDSIRTDLSDYLWPTSASRAITSTFGEFRKTHFHAGIDISTHDRTGYPVFATRDGYVSRISVSPDGYGTMLQIRHPDGYTSTYAHLDRYAGAIAERARAEQRAKERFAVDLRPAPREIPVKKGDLVAYSGETGAGTAHLHFEILDENSNALNPFLCRDFTILDTIAPTMSAIGFIPLAPHSTVNGSSEPRVMRLRDLGHGAYELPGTVSLSGPVGVAVTARDRSNETWFRHGVYNYRLFLDDSLLFEVRIDRVPVPEAKQIGLYYHWDLLARRRGRLEKLYVDSPNSIPFLSPNREGAGFITGGGISEGVHRLTVLASDRHGNSSRLSARVIVNHPPTISAALNGDSVVVTLDDPPRVSRIVVASRQSSGGSWRTRVFQPEGGFPGKRFAFLPSPGAAVIRVNAENASGSLSAPAILLPVTLSSGTGSLSIRTVCEESFIRLRVTTTGIFTAPPVVTVQEGSRARTISLAPVDVDAYAGAYVPGDSPGGALPFSVRAGVDGVEKSARTSLEVYPIVPGRSGVYSIDGGRLLIEYTSTSAFKPLLVRVTRMQEDGDTAYLLEPAHTILRSGIRVSLPCSTSRSEALYLLTNRGRTRIGGEKRKGMLSGTLHRTLGKIAILSDTEPPSVGRLTISGGRRTTFSFGYHDDLSGVDYDEFKTYIDSVAVIPEIDGEHHRAFYRSADQIQRGPHQLTIRLSDNQGNATTVERRFIVR